MSHYAIEIFYSEEDEGHVAVVPELPGYRSARLRRKPCARSRRPWKHGWRWHTPMACPFPHRAAPYLLIIGAAWEPGDDSARHIAWARGVGDAVAPYTTGASYVNELGLEEDEGAAQIKAAFGANYDRLASIKAKYDPQNLFRHNQNIKPAV